MPSLPPPLLIINPFFNNILCKRETEALRWWEDGETLGGRDLVGGGTWLGCTRKGRIAFLTNFRETSSIPDAKSRGHLPLRYLQSEKSPAEFAQEIEKEASLYNGFNLVVAHVLSKSMFYITNRPLHGDKQHLVTLVSPGIHVLSNANLDSPWPKVTFLPFLLFYFSTSLPQLLFSCSVSG